MGEDHIDALTRIVPQQPCASEPRTTDENVGEAEDAFDLVDETHLPKKKKAMQSDDNEFDSENDFYVAKCDSEDEYHTTKRNERNISAGSDESDGSDDDGDDKDPSVFKVAKLLDKFTGAHVCITFTLGGVNIMQRCDDTWVVMVMSEW